VALTLTRLVKISDNDQIESFLKKTRTKLRQRKIGEPI